MTGHNLRIQHKPGMPLTPAHQQEFLQVATDDRLTPEEKQQIYRGEASYKQLLSHQRQKEVTKSQQEFAEHELNDFNPVYVDPRIEHLRKLNPDELNKRLNY